MLIASEKINLFASTWVKIAAANERGSSLMELDLSVQVDENFLEARERPMAELVKNITDVLSFFKSRVGNLKTRSI